MNREPMLAETTTYLGPARILEVLDSRVEIELPDGQASAMLALGPYRPAAGDLVLAIGGENGFYIIGVLQGSGPVTIASPGDLHLIAANGVISVLSAKSVSLKSPTIRFQANRLEVAARAVFERFSTVYTWVKDTMQLRTGRMRTTVRESYHVAADRIVEKARKDVTIDGDSINLG